MPTADTTSNWDLSPVLELLRSPTLPHSELSRNEPTTPISAAPQPKSLHSLNDTSDYPRLGDFGPLWDFLNHSVSTTPTASIPDHHANTDFAALLSPCVESRPIKVPGHAPETPFGYENVGDTTKWLFIEAPAKHDPASIASRSETHVHNSTTAVGTAKTGPDLDSDSGASVFDRPLHRKRGVMSFIPSQVGAPGIVSDSSITPPSSYEEPCSIARPVHPRTSANEDYRVHSTRYRSSGERQVGLLTKLLKQFPDFAERVAELGRSRSLVTGDTTRNSIHVFVDMSNIMVGFHDLVKTSRNIPANARIRRLPLSFHNFSLILERGRPSAKRVLVGSDRFPAVREAEAIGYETNILKRVQKIKGWTPRPATKHRGLPKDPGYALDSAAGSGSGSGGSETDTAAATTEERWVEQGVDEILHLKILESLVDTDEPSTMVLATGDAAVAEYSDGFMKMVTRALTRGWSVELVSFSLVTSYAYRRREFRAQWGSRFKIIMLDDYVEELLDL